MIAVHLLPYTTQVVVAKKKKDMLVILDYFYLRNSYLDDFTQCDVSQLAEMFREINNECKDVRSEQVYIVIPDSVFQRIDCFDYVDNISAYESEISNLSDCYYAQPIELKRTTKHKQTSCFIRKDIIDTLCQAAEIQNIKLYCIEAASIAMLRVLDKWKSEVMILNASHKYSYISSYSVMAGLYTTVLSDDLAENVDTDPESVNEALNAIFTTVEFTNKKTFANNNPSVPTYVIAENENICRLSVLSERRATVNVPACLKEIDNAILSEYMAPVGALMQVLSLDTGSNALTLHSSNVLPSEKLSSNKFEHFKETFKKLCKYTSVAAVILIIAEAAGIFYFSSNTIPQDLEENYNEAKAKMPELEAADSRITQCQQEDEHIPEALYALISNKPQDLGFTSLTIGSKGSANKDASKVSKAEKSQKENNSSEKQKKKNEKAKPAKPEKWISLDIRTPNPLTIQEYVNTLNQFEIFDNIVTEEISAESKKSTAYQSAKIHILKGNVGNE